MLAGDGLTDDGELDALMVAIERLAAGWWLPCRWLALWRAANIHR